MKKPIEPTFFKPENKEGKENEQWPKGYYQKIWHTYNWSPRRRAEGKREKTSKEIISSKKKISQTEINYGPMLTKYSTNPKQEKHEGNHTKAPHNPTAN